MKPRRRLLLAFSLLLSAVGSHAALITERFDTTFGSPSLNGVINPNEYGPANSYVFTGGGTNFGGQFGNASLLMKSDDTYLYVAFSNLGIPTDGNQYMVYFNTRNGGLQPDGVAMDDTTDSARRNASILSLYGLDSVTFHDGVSQAPDYALVMNNRNVDGFSAVYELKPAGQVHGLITHSRSALGATVVEFRIPLASIGVTNGGIIDVMAINNSDTGFLSNEGIPNPNLSGNIGFGDGTTNVFADFHRFNTLAINSYQGISERKPNMTLKFPQSIPLQTTNSYTTVNAFPGLVFTNPLVMATAPGETNRMYVVERAGRIQVITNLMQPSRTLFMNLTANMGGLGSEGGLLGLAFHPNYVSNRYFYVFYTPNANNGTGNGMHTRVSRFQRTATNENLALTSTEAVLYSQYNEAANHNGGDIHFGPDGYLYIATGDEGGGNDAYNNAQFIDKDFFAGLLRMDVDQKPGSLAPNYHPAHGGVTNYAIPPDNPFIGITNYYGSNLISGRVRTEFFAVGLRNPFRFSIDTIGGHIYVADVGQNAWEEINLVTNGGNYGWAAREGFTNGPKPGVFSATNYANPVLVYGRGTATNQGTSVTGGRVYRGDRIPELVGKYIFADYASGHIWSMTHNGTTSTSFAWLSTDQSIVAFGEHPLNGDLLMCDLTANQIKRLDYANTDTNALPINLSEAGIFSDMNTLTTYEGIVPYTVNVPFWSDGAIKRRWFSLPNTNQNFTFNPTGSWIAPTTTVWIKHFDIYLTSGVPSSVRRLETRVMVKSDQPDGGYGVTYRWGNSTSNAVLVPALGLDEEIIINDSGIIRTQLWRYPSRGACLGCHNINAGFTLSFNTPQMNTTHDFGDKTTNQIAALHQAGYFSGAVSNIHLLRKLATPDETEFSVAYRARSYLDANCAPCHRPGGPVPAAFDARIFTPLSQAGIIDGLLANDFGNTDNRVIRRGSPPHSMVLTRIDTLDLRRMPPIGSTVLDTQSIALVTAWITGEASTYETFEEWQIRHFGSSDHPDAQPEEDPDDDGNNNALEFRTGTQPTNSVDVWVFDALDTSDPVPTLTVERTPNTGIEVQVTTNLIDGSWFSLDVPENAPVFSTGTTTMNVPDPDATNHVERYYRTRMYEP